MNTKTIIWIVIIALVIVAGQDVLTHALGLVDAANCGIFEACL